MCGASAGRGSRSAVGAGFAVLFVCTGVNLSFGILFKSILQEFGGDRASLALAATASLGVNALSQPFFGLLIDRFGPRRVILPSMALMALGTGLVSLAQSAWQVTLLYGGVAALGSASAGCETRPRSGCGRRRAARPRTWAPARTGAQSMGTPASWWMTAGYIGCGFTDFLLTTHLAPLPFSGPPTCSTT